MLSQPSTTKFSSFKIVTLKRRHQDSHLGRQRPQPAGRLHFRPTHSHSPAQPLRGPNTTRISSSVSPATQRAKLRQIGNQPSGSLFVCTLDRHLPSCSLRRFTCVDCSSSSLRIFNPSLPTVASPFTHPHARSLPCTQVHSLTHSRLFSSGPLRTGSRLGLLAPLSRHSVARAPPFGPRATPRLRLRPRISAA